MKLVMGIVFFLSPLFANALDCTDFSGTWATEGGDPLVIEQSDCDGFTLAGGEVVFGQPSTYQLESGSVTDMFVWDADKVGLHLDSVGSFQESPERTILSNYNYILTLDGEDMMKVTGNAKTLNYVSGVREETLVEVEAVYNRQ